MIISNNALRLRRLRMRRLKRKEKEEDTKNNKTGEKNKMAALSYLEAMLLRPKRHQKNEIIALEKIFLRSLIITIIRRAIILRIISEQKPCSRLSDLYVDGSLLGRLIAYILHLISGLISEK